MATNDLQVKVSAITKEFDSRMKSVEEKLRNVDRTADSCSKSSEKWGNRFNSAASKVKPLSAAAAGVSAAATKSALSFQAQMGKVKAISGATSKELDKLSKSAISSTNGTVFSAQEAAQAYEYMGMAGWKCEEMISGLPAILQLATASGEDLGLVSDIVTDGLTAMGLSAKDSAKFSDVLAATVTNSNTNVAMMGDTFKYAAPLAGSLGYSIEDLSLSIGLMANAGIKSSKAGTALRGALMGLVKPTKSGSQAMEAMGIKVKDSTGKMLPLRQVLKQLRKGFNGMSESQKALTAETLFGREAMTGMLAIINASEDDFNKLAKSIDNSSGATKKMADEVNKASPAQRALSSIKNSFIQIGQVALPTIDKIVKKIELITQKISKMSPEQKKVIAMVVSTVAVLAPLLSIVGKVSLGFSAVSKAVGGFKIATLAAAGPAILAVGGISAGVFLLAKNWDKVKDFGSKALEKIKGKSGETKDKVSKDSDSMADKLKSVFKFDGEFKLGEKINNSFKNIKIPDIGKSVTEKIKNIHMPNMKEKTDETVNSINQSFEGVEVPDVGAKVYDAVDLIRVPSVGERISEAFQDFSLDKFEQRLKSEAERVKTNIKNLFDLNKVSDIGNDITNAFNSISLPNMASSVMSSFSNIGDGISKGWDMAKQAMPPGIQKAFGGIESKVKPLLKPLESTFGEVKSYANQALMPLHEPIQKTWELTGKILGDSWTGIEENAKETFGKIKDFFNSDFWNDAKQSMTESWNSISESLHKIWGLIFQNVGDTFNDIVDYLSDIWEGLKPVFEGAWKVISTILGVAWKGLVVVAKTVFKVLSYFFENVFVPVAEAMSEVWTGIRTVLAETWNGIKTTAEEVFGPIKEMVEKMWDKILEVWPPIWEKIKGMIKKACDFVGKIIKGTSDLVLGIFGDLYRCVYSQAVLAWTSIKRIFNGVKNIIIGVFTGDTQRIKDGVRDLFGGLKTFIVGTFNNLIKLIKNTFGRIFEAAKGPFKKIRTKVGEILDFIYDHTVGKIKETFNNVVTSVQDGIQNAINAARAKVSAFVHIGRDMVQGLINGIINNASRLYDNMVNLVSNAVNKAKEFLGIASPSRVFRDEVGKWIPSGMSVGIDANAGEVEDAMNGLTNLALDSADMDDLNITKIPHYDITGIGVDERETQPSPAYINLTLGRRSYRTFVEDISKEQEATISIDRAYSF